jgi:hypothetical protein
LVPQLLLTALPPVTLPSLSPLRLSQHRHRKCHSQCPNCANGATTTAAKAKTVPVPPAAEPQSQLPPRLSPGSRLWPRESAPRPPAQNWRRYHCPHNLKSVLPPAPTRKQAQTPAPQNLGRDHRHSNPKCVPPPAWLNAAARAPRKSAQPSPTQN